MNESRSIPTASPERWRPMEGKMVDHGSVHSQLTNLEGGYLGSHLHVLAESSAHADLAMARVVDTMLLNDTAARPTLVTSLNCSVKVLGSEKISEMLTSLIQQDADLGICAASNLPFPLPDKLDVMALIQAARQVPTGPVTSESHSLQEQIAVIARTRRPELQALFYGVDLRQRWGKVWLIGFGPGDPELMTLKADRILRQADIIYYDDLIDHAILDTYPGIKKYVGKRKGNHAEAQEAINELLYQSALMGRTVARLKGGDPFIFGRGGEEAEYLLKRLVAVEIIPGVSAVNAAAAACRVPLTKRGVSWSVALRTAHCGEILQQHPDQGETLVYYMAASRLISLSAELLSKGLSPSTPVVLVQNASLPDEQIAATTVQEMGWYELKSPLLVIVGHVARDRHRQRTLLYTGSDFSTFRSNERLIHYPLGGAAFTRFETKETKCQGLPDFQRIDGIVFSSPSIVDNFVDLHGLPASWMLNYALDQATFERLSQYGIPRERIVLFRNPPERDRQGEEYPPDGQFLYTNPRESAGSGEQACS